MSAGELFWRGILWFFLALLFLALITSIGIPASLASNRRKQNRSGH